MTYTVSSGALNCTQTKTCIFRQFIVRPCLNVNDWNSTSMHFIMLLTCSVWECYRNFTCTVHKLYLVGTCPPQKRPFPYWGQRTITEGALGTPHNGIWNLNDLAFLYTHPSAQHTNYTHMFNGPFSSTTWVSQYHKGKTYLDFIEARDIKKLSLYLVSWFLVYATPLHNTIWV